MLWDHAVVCGCVGGTGADPELKRAAVPVGTAARPIQLRVSFLQPNTPAVVTYLRLGQLSTASQLRQAVADEAGIPEGKADVHVRRDRDRVSRIENLCQKHGGVAQATLKDLEFDDGRDVFVEYKQAKDSSTLAKSEVSCVY